MDENIACTHQNRFTQHWEHMRDYLLAYLQKIIPTRNYRHGVQSMEEEKVYSWLYTLAEVDQDLVFEYVKSTERGLSFKEAERRLKDNGPNIPLDHASPKWWKLLGNAFFHPFNVILIILSTLSYIAGDNANGSIMVALVFISVGLRFHQEHRSSKSAMKLSELLKTPAKVQRCAGRTVQKELTVQIDQRDIVPGDIVSFGPGDMFPGDVRLLKSKDLIVSQSSLTGESRTLEKIADIKEDETTHFLELRNICLMGTSVISGCGNGLVVSTGSKTYISTIFSILGKGKPQDSFEKSVRCISYALIGVMLVVAPIIVLSDYYASHDMSQSILYGISVAVALTPQMLPLIVNVNLANGATAMAKEKCIVKSMLAIQKMGAMDILCIDKTGTLTMDCAIMVHHLDSWGFPAEMVLQFAFLNSYFKSELRSPIDNAILAYVYSNGHRFEPSKWRKVDEVPFDFIRRRVSVTVDTDSYGTYNDGSACDTQRFMITKGALEEVLRTCRFIEKKDEGKIMPITVEDCQRVLQLGEELSNNGLQVLGVAMRKIILETRNDGGINNDIIEFHMIFLGIITFFDPPKHSAKQAISRLAEKGIQAKLLTGDSLPLAIKTCKDVGVSTTHVITGPELELLDQSEFHDIIKRVTVLARLSPTQKRHVVKSLQTAGNHVVGFLGDGLNDSLALESADVGISVDSGASAAKDLADIILLEKDLNVLVSCVERGRITYGNTMKYIKMALVASFGSVSSFLIAATFLGFEPLTSRQILTQNILYNVAQITIPWDKVEEEYVKIPQHWSTKGLPVFMLWNGSVCSMFDVATFAFLWYYYGANKSPASKLFHSAWFVEGLLMQTLIIHLIRTEKIAFIQDTASWPLICSTAVVSAVGMTIPYTLVGQIMGLSDLPLSYFGFLLLHFLGYFSFGHFAKRAYILAFKHWL